MNSNKIINLNTPTNTSDATTKQYVDDLTAYYSGGGITRNSGGGLEVGVDVMRYIDNTILIHLNYSGLNFYRFMELILQPVKG